ncbi:DUF6323 family protein [Caproiciproducens sp. LBM24188]
MENTLSALFALDALSNQLAINELLKKNETTAQYGLILTPQDAAELLETRACALNETGRIEIGSATIGKIVDAFGSSTFLNQDNYAATLCELTELFYAVKNETEDRISDDDLIAFLKDCFENRCGGSLELLAGRELEKLADNLRFGITDFFNMDAEILFEGDLAAQAEEKAEEEQERNRWEELELE